MIAEFYKDTEIFITGGSGVVGKAAIEKLLRSCDVKKIYVLLRCKKGVSAEDRLVEMKKCRIFKVLKEFKPNELDKLVVIPGDTSCDGLGISPENKEMMKNVSVFFHSAATTRFDEPLKTAIRLNLKSTVEALKLAETLKNLKIFIHVSTFYSNPYLKRIEDKVYKPVFDWRTALKILDDDEIDPVVNTITNKVINGFPNTYLFTKHLAEQVVDEYRFKLPVGIYRPSIVITALEEPEPGFTESSTGIMGLILVCGLGLLKTLFCRKDMQLDLTPLDLGTKVLLASTVRAAKLPREKVQETTPVTLFSSQGYVKVNMGEQVKYFLDAVNHFPYEKSIWLPSFKLTSCPFLYAFITITMQLFPSLLIDGLLKLFGQEPFLMKIQRKIFVTTHVLSFFLTREFESDGITNFEELLELAKGTEFSIDIVLLAGNYDEKIAESARQIVYGCRKFILNDDDSTLSRSRKIFRAKEIVYNILRGYLLYVIGRRLFGMAMSYIGQQEQFVLF